MNPNSGLPRCGCALLFIFPIYIANSEDKVSLKLSENFEIISGEFAPNGSKRLVGQEAIAKVICKGEPFAIGAEVMTVDLERKRVICTGYAYLKGGDQVVAMRGSSR